MSVHLDFLFPAAKANPNIAGTTAASCGLWAGHKGGRALGGLGGACAHLGGSGRAVPHLLTGGPFHIVASLWKLHGYNSGIVGLMLSGPGLVLAGLGGPVPGCSQILGLRQPLKTDQSVITGKGRTHDRDEGTASSPLTPASSTGSGELEP